MNQRPRKKMKKSKPDNWFETCTVDELKQLCKASLVRISGNKAAVVERLL
jgi:hypothetical protein